MWVTKDIVRQQLQLAVQLRLRVEAAASVIQVDMAKAIKPAVSLAQVIQVSSSSVGGPALEKILQSRVIVEGSVTAKVSFLDFIESNHRLNSLSQIFLSIVPQMRIQACVSSNCSSGIGVPGVRRYHRRMATIGIFDSGVGGLSVLAALCERLPNNHVVYVADTAHVPYGPRSLQQVREFSLASHAFSSSRKHTSLS